MRWIACGGWLVMLVCAAAAGCVAQTPAPTQPDGNLHPLNRLFKSTMTCGEFNDLLKAGDKATAGTAIPWLDGVYSGRSGLGDFPAGWARTLSQGVGGTCAMTVNASRPVLDVIAGLRRQYGGAAAGR